MFNTNLQVFWTHLQLLYIHFVHLYNCFAHIFKYCIHIYKYLHIITNILNSLYTSIYKYSTQISKYSLYLQKKTKINIFVLFEFKCCLILHRSTCLPVHLAADSWLDSYSSSCGLDCTDRRFRVMVRSFPLEIYHGWPSSG